MSQDRRKPWFRYRIKDLMIVNAVLGITLGLSMALSNRIQNKLQILRALFAGLIAAPFVILVIVGPLALVEMYLYGKKKGSWYRLQNPAKPRPRYQRPTDLPPYIPTTPLQEESSNPRSRTRLFESIAPAESVSRASILLNVASQFEASGRMEAASKVYHQILERFPNATEAQDAAHRLQSLSER